MQPAPALQPTLWRTCRGLANLTRLKIFGFLLRQSWQPVSAVARQLHLPLPVASRDLRILESRGLLAARRSGRWVNYRISPAKSAKVHSSLLAALRGVFQRDPEPAQTIFALATAFTHPRRVEIFKVLKTGPRTLEQLRSATGISIWALLRHLRKLEKRGFVIRREKHYNVPDFSNGLRRELSRLTTARANERA